MNAFEELIGEEVEKVLIEMGYLKEAKE